MTILSRTLARINSIYVIESLASGEARTGQQLFDAIVYPETRKLDGLHAEFCRAEDRKQLDAKLRQLRFADLNIIAPNTLYPMFIVAPREKKGRLREQLRRPTFKRLELDKKVRFLSYESIDEIDQFFSGASSGLNVDVIVARSEPAV